MIFVIILWIALCFIVASLGSSREIGSVGAFFISLIFSPLIGLIVVLISSPIEQEKTFKKTVSVEVDGLTKESISKYTQKDYSAALDLMLKALLLDATNPTSHINLASLYSLLKDKENTFKHLTRAVECGYDKYDVIQTHSDFEWIRNQTEYRDFVTNGYKFESNSQKSSYIDDLIKLSKLKDEGIITEQEFNEQKTKILSSSK